MPLEAPARTAAQLCSHPTLGAGNDASITLS